ncbi:Triosephosphate isomerase [Mrakia frigida]|uniref:Triosephosphate isomerase n=1 Tax=Mrakia frigida TaxID=29902 RepID=UPI003FCBF0CE
MVPLVCIGELFDNGVDAAVEEVRPQIESLLAAIPKDADVVLAYEPVWAIGKPEPAGAEYVVGVTKRLREIAEGYLVGGERRTGEIRMLYGGSAGPGLFEKLKDGVDGLFLGRFGHDVQNFEAVMRELVA